MSQKTKQKGGKDKIKDYSPHFVYLHKDKFEKEALQTNLNSKGKIIASPLSGSEPQFEPNKWNLNPKIKKTHNCYSYAVNMINEKHQGKPQPGYFSGFDHVEDNEYNCKAFHSRLKEDLPSMYLTSFEQPCKKGFHKAFMAIDDKETDQDYHFYRQDKTGMWSHKPGKTEVINIDASGKKIINPLKANRDYTYFSYKKPCFFFCVNPKLSRTKSRKLSPTTIVND